MFSLEIETLARLLIDEARERNLRIVTAESCTGGLVAGAICSISGASDVFERGFVTYTNRAKQELLGIPGDNTYANYAEANRVLWRQTVVPLACRLADGLAALLQPYADGSLKLVPDLDQVEALAPDRDALWKRVNDAAFLTVDEKRAAVGYGG